MPPQVTVLRPDGSVLRVSKEQAEKLKLLGYHEETTEEILARSAEEGRAASYQEQGVQTAIEGLGRGATLGLTDYLATNTDERAARAQYNPGIATASEIVGAVGSEFIPGLNVVAPAAMVGRGARAAVKGTGVGASAVRGAIEGGAFGGAMAADHAYLKGDPITAEAVLHGVGWGSLFGAGLSAAGTAIAKRGSAGVAKGTEMIDTAASDLVSAQRGATAGSYEAAAGPAFQAFKAETKALSKEIKQATDTVEAILGNNRKKIALMTGEPLAAGTVGRARIEATSAFRKFAKALNKKGFSEEKLAEAAEQFQSSMARTAEKAGLVSGNTKQALMEYAEMKILQKELNGIPHTASGFAKLSKDKAERIFGAMERAKKLSKFPVLGKAVEEQASKLQEALGLTPSGVTGLRSAWANAKAQVAAEKASLKTPKLEEAKPGLLRRVGAAAAGFATYKAVASTGHPLLAVGVASKVRNKVLNAGVRTPELVAARNATLGRIKQAVGKFQVGTGKTVARIGPRIEPLAFRLDGTADTSTTDKSQLAMNRLSEFASAAPHVRNTLYRAIEPIAVEQPELGPALHQSGVAAFTAMRGLLPTDPGVVSGLKSIWRPSSLQSAVMSQQYSVWQDPVGAAEEMLSTGIFDPIRVKTLKTVAPAVYEHLRTEMFGKIQEPGFMDNMDYRAQVALGSLLDIPIHSSMRPEFIAASQQLHTTRNQPLPTPAVPGSTNGGRPAADTPGATAAQITTAR